MENSKKLIVSGILILVLLIGIWQGWFSETWELIFKITAFMLCLLFTFFLISDEK